MDCDRGQASGRKESGHAKVFENGFRRIFRPPFPWFQRHRRLCRMETVTAPRCPCTVRLTSRDRRVSPFGDRDPSLVEFQRNIPLFAALLLATDSPPAHTRRGSLAGERERRVLLEAVTVFPSRHSSPVDAGNTGKGVAKIAPRTIVESPSRAGFFAATPGPRITSSCRHSNCVSIFRFWQRFLDDSLQWSNFFKSWASPKSVPPLRPH